MKYNPVLMYQGTLRMALCCKNRWQKWDGSDTINSTLTKIDRALVKYFRERWERKLIHELHLVMLSISVIDNEKIRSFRKVFITNRIIVNNIF